MKVNKLLNALVVLLFSQQVFAQAAKPGNQFILNGKLTGGHADTVFIRYQSDTGKVVYQQTPIVKNEFTITGYINQPVSASVSFKTNGKDDSGKSFFELEKEIYLEPGKLSINGDPSNVPALILTGSKTQLELNKLTKETVDIHEAMNQLSHQFDQYVKEKNKAKIAEIHAKYEGYSDKEKDIDYKFFLVHPNSYVTVNKILSYTNGMGIDSIVRIYNNYNAEIKASHLGAKLATEIKKIQMGAGTPGTAAANFTASDINGKPLSLTDFKGKYVILDFWASWCVPCRKGNPHMITVYNAYKSKGLDIIGVSGDGPNFKAWKNAVDNDKVGIWHHIRSNVKNSPQPDAVDTKYGIRTLPTKILIDPNGNIIGRFGDNLGGTDEDMDKMLASIFNK